MYQLHILLSVIWRKCMSKQKHNISKILQVNLVILDFKHLYDLFRWKFLMIVNRYAHRYCEPLGEILDFQYHNACIIADKYNGGFKWNIVSSIYRHCVDLLVTAQHS